MPHGKRKFLSFLGTCLLAFQAGGATASSAQGLYQKIDSVMSAVARRDQFAGAVLVVDKGVLVYQKAFGPAVLATGKALTVSSMFELASLTKQFTAMGIMILRERGKLDYQDELEKYFPALPYKGVTIRHLLNHTSGLPDFKALFDEKWDKSKIADNDDVLELFAEYRPPAEFAPGEAWAYSNTGYVMLASIIEKVSGETYREFLQRHIFDKLDMRRTRVVTRRFLPEKFDDFAYGYVFSFAAGGYVLPDEEVSTKRVVYLDGVVGSGRIHSTIEDLYKWDRALAVGALVSPERLKEAFTEGRLNDGSGIGYGFGWLVGTNKKRRMFSHTGSYPGYAHISVRFPEIDRSIVILTLNDAYPRLWEILDEALDGNRAIVPPLRADLAIKRGLMGKKPPAIAEMIEAILREKSRYEFDRVSLDRLGQDALDAGKIDEAVEIFKLIVDVLPPSADAHESLADAYRLRGDGPRAIEHYKEALKIDSERERVKAMLRELEKK